jgi:hypothetical protein
MRYDPDSSRRQTLLRALAQVAVGFVASLVATLPAQGAYLAYENNPVDNDSSNDTSLLFAFADFGAAYSQPFYPHATLEQTSVAHAVVPAAPAGYSESDQIIHDFGGGTWSVLSSSLAEAYQLAVSPFSDADGEAEITLKIMPGPGEHLHDPATVYCDWSMNASGIAAGGITVQGGGGSIHVSQSGGDPRRVTTTNATVLGDSGYYLSEVGASILIAASTDAHAGQLLGASAFAYLYASVDSYPVPEPSTSILAIFGSVATLIANLGRLRRSCCS